MKKLKVSNLILHYKKDFNKIKIGKYTFLPLHEKKWNQQDDLFVHGDDAFRFNMNIHHNAYVQFTKRQKDSILYKGGQATLHTKRKHLDDVLTILSILTGHNVALYSRRNTPQFPLTLSNHLMLISWSWSQLSKDAERIISTISQRDLLEKYDRGFHLIMLTNHSNVHVEEVRFLSMYVIWEWLFAKEFGTESRDLRIITSEILKRKWPRLMNKKIFNQDSHNIYTVLRNQLAHSGRLPIDRPFAKKWMTKLEPESVSKYLNFFTKLTQILVLDTLGINVLNRRISRVKSIDIYLREFLKYGKIKRYHKVL